MVGDIIKPNQAEKYVFTRSPHMIEGVVKQVFSFDGMGDMRIMVTKYSDGQYGENKTGSEYPVHSEFFDLAKALTSDEAFKQYLAGYLTETQYEELMRRERG